MGNGFVVRCGGMVVSEIRVISFLAGMVVGEIGGGFFVVIVVVTFLWLLLLFFFFFF